MTMQKNTTKNGFNVLCVAGLRLRIILCVAGSGRAWGVREEEGISVVVVVFLNPLPRHCAYLATSQKRFYLT